MVITGVARYALVFSSGGAASLSSFSRLATRIRTVLLVSVLLSANTLVNSISDWDSTLWPQYREMIEQTTKEVLKLDKHRTNEMMMTQPSVGFVHLPNLKTYVTYYVNETETGLGSSALVSEGEGVLQPSTKQLTDNEKFRKMQLWWKTGTVSKGWHKICTDPKKEETSLNNSAPPEEETAPDSKNGGGKASDGRKSRGGLEENCDLCSIGEGGDFHLAFQIRPMLMIIAHRLVGLADRQQSLECRTIYERIHFLKEEHEVRRKTETAKAVTEGEKRKINDEVKASLKKEIQELKQHLTGHRWCEKYEELQRDIEPESTLLSYEGDTNYLRRYFAPQGISSELREHLRNTIRVRKEKAHRSRNKEETNGKTRPYKPRPLLSQMDFSFTELIHFDAPSFPCKFQSDAQAKGRESTVSPTMTYYSPYDVPISVFPILKSGSRNMMKFLISETMPQLGYFLYEFSLLLRVVFDVWMHMIDGIQEMISSLLLSAHGSHFYDLSARKHLGREDMWKSQMFQRVRNNFVHPETFVRRMVRFTANSDVILGLNEWGILPDIKNMIAKRLRERRKEAAAERKKDCGSKGEENVDWEDLQRELIEDSFRSPLIDADVANFLLRLDQSTARNIVDGSGKVFVDFEYSYTEEPVSRLLHQILGKVSVTHLGHQIRENRLDNIDTNNLSNIRDVIHIDGRGQTDFNPELLMDPDVVSPNRDRFLTNATNQIVDVLSPMFKNVLTNFYYRFRNWYDTNIMYGPNRTATETAQIDPSRIAMDPFLNHGAFEPFGPEKNETSLFKVQTGFGVNQAGCSDKIPSSSISFSSENSASSDSKESQNTTMAIIPSENQGSQSNVTDDPYYSLEHKLLSQTLTRGVLQYFPIATAKQQLKSGDADPITRFPESMVVMRRLPAHVIGPCCMFSTDDRQKVMLARNPFTRFISNAAFWLSILQMLLHEDFQIIKRMMEIQSQWVDRNCQDELTNATAGVGTPGAKSSSSDQQQDAATTKSNYKSDDKSDFRFKMNPTMNIATSQVIKGTTGSSIFNTLVELEIQAFCDKEETIFENDPELIFFSNKIKHWIGQGSDHGKSVLGLDKEMQVDKEFQSDPSLHHRMTHPLRGSFILLNSTSEIRVMQNRLATLSHGRLRIGFDSVVERMIEMYYPPNPMMYGLEGNFRTTPVVIPALGVEIVYTRKSDDQKVSCRLYHADISPYNLVHNVSEQLINRLMGADDKGGMDKSPSEIDNDEKNSNTKRKINSKIPKRSCSKQKWTLPEAQIIYVLHVFHALSKVAGGYHTSLANYRPFKEFQSLAAHLRSVKDTLEDYWVAKVGKKQERVPAEHLFEGYFMIHLERMDEDFGERLPRKLCRDKKWGCSRHSNDHASLTSSSNKVPASKNDATMVGPMVSRNTSDNVNDSSRISTTSQNRRSQTANATLDLNIFEQFFGEKTKIFAGDTRSNVGDCSFSIKKMDFRGECKGSVRWDVIWGENSHIDVVGTFLEYFEEDIRYQGYNEDPFDLLPT